VCERASESESASVRERASEREREKERYWEGERGPGTANRATQASVEREGNNFKGFDDLHLKNVKNRNPDLALEYVPNRSIALVLVSG